MGKTFSYTIDFSDTHDFKQGEYPVIYELQTTNSDLLGYKYNTYANQFFTGPFVM